MAKHERDRVAVGENSSKGEHGGNRGGARKDQQGKDNEAKAKAQSDPAAGKDPHRGNR